MTIEDILYEIDPDSEWDDMLTEINGEIEEYDKKRFGSASEEIEDITEKHLNPILPKYWEVFHTHNIYRRQNGDLRCQDSNTDMLICYDVGVFLVGYSSLPIVLSLAEIQPCQDIYFLYSRETQDSGALDEIADRIKIMRPECAELINLVENPINREIDNPSDPVATFKLIKEVIDGIGEDKTIALDLTGGKKTMIGGAFTAGAIWGFSEAIEPSVCDMYYVDSLEYNQRRGGPEPGTEFLCELKNPYDVYNVQSNLEADELFAKHNYESAVSLWDGVQKKLKDHADQYGLETEEENVLNNHKRATCYSHWDAFYYDKAKEEKEDHGNSWGYNEKHIHNNSIDVVDILSEVTDRDTLFENDQTVIHYAVDRWQNARRRKESRKLDDAIVRFTQVIEILCRYQTHKIVQANGFINMVTRNAEEPSRIRTKELSPLIGVLFGQEPLREGQHINYVIRDGNLRLSLNDYGGRDEYERLRECIVYRNDFIHFNSSMQLAETEKTVTDLECFARTFLEKFSSDYCRDNDLSFNALLNLHEFQRL